MTQQKFDEINNHFNSLIGENGLLDDMTVIDGESIISRVYKKCNGKIDSDVLSPCFEASTNHLTASQSSSLIIFPDEYKIPSLKHASL